MCSGWLHHQYPLRTNRCFGCLKRQKILPWILFLDLWLLQVLFGRNYKSILWCIFATKPYGGFGMLLGSNVYVFQFRAVLDWAQAIPRFHRVLIHSYTTFWSSNGSLIYMVLHPKTKPLAALPQVQGKQHAHLQNLWHWFLFVVMMWRVYPLMIVQCCIQRIKLYKKIFFCRNRLRRFLLSLVL